MLMHQVLGLDQMRLAGFFVKTISAGFLQNETETRQTTLFSHVVTDQPASCDP